jgi:hypothetical protein
MRHYRIRSLHDQPALFIAKRSVYVPRNAQWLGGQQATEMLRNVSENSPTPIQPQASTLVNLLRMQVENEMMLSTPLRHKDRANHDMVCC